MKTRFLSRFTPSLMPPEALEAVFIQREQLSQEVLARIRKSVSTGRGERLLLVGPRGIGKTHFISITFYRVQEMKDLRDLLLVAWLREEEWGVTTFRDLLIRILRALATQMEDASSLEKQIESIHLLSSERAEAAAAAALNEMARGRSLLLLVENLDDLLQRLGSDGQQRFRSFMQAHLSYSIVCSSPVASGDVIRPGVPFSGFFQILRLEELTFEDAVRLMTKIACYEGNDALAAFVATPRGRARIRALRYLAGGNHRAYVIFSQLLARESLDELMEPLLRTIDDLTPYYNSRIATLSPEQRKVIEFVCDARHPVRIAEVARGCFLIPGAAAIQLEGLSKAGYLHSLGVGQERYYELREPLMRLSIEVKKHRGKPIRMLLDFLRLWYSPAELKQRLAVLPPEALLEREYALPALEITEKDWEDPRTAECCREYDHSIERSDFARALQAAEELVSFRGLLSDVAAQASCLVRLKRYGEAVALYDRILTLTPGDADAWHLKGRALLCLGRLEDALAACDKSIDLDKGISRAWCDRGAILIGLGRPDEALASCDGAIQLNDKDALAWTTRGKALADMGSYEEAAEAFRTVVKLDPRNGLAFDYLCAALVEMKRYDEALIVARRATELDPSDSVALVLRGTALSGLHRHAEALESFEEAIRQGEDSSLAQFSRAELLLALNRWRLGAAALDGALSRFAQSKHRDAGNTSALVRNLTSNLSDPGVLRLCLKVLVLLYKKHRALPALGHGLVASIPEVVSPEVFSDAEARLWRDSWNAVAGELPEFGLPLRFLEFSVRYRETRDLHVFMELPQEERTMIEPMIGVRVQETA